MAIKSVLPFKLRLTGDAKFGIFIKQLDGVQRDETSGKFAPGQRITKYDDLPVNGIERHFLVKRLGTDKENDDKRLTATPAYSALAKEHDRLDGERAAVEETVRLEVAEAVAKKNHFTRGFYTVQLYKQKCSVNTQLAELKERLEELDSQMHALRPVHTIVVKDDRGAYHRWLNKVMRNDPENFINANYIDGFDVQSKYIATQAPISQAEKEREHALALASVESGGKDDGGWMNKLETVTNFWRMVWEKKTKVRAWHSSPTLRSAPPPLNCVALPCTVGGCTSAAVWLGCPALWPACRTRSATHLFRRMARQPSDVMLFCALWHHNCRPRVVAEPPRSSSWRPTAMSSRAPATTTTWVATTKNKPNFSPRRSRAARRAIRLRKQV